MAVAVVIDNSGSMRDKRPAVNQADGIHPNAKGVEVIVRRILSLVIKTIENMDAAGKSSRALRPAPRLAFFVATKKVSKEMAFSCGGHDFRERLRRFLLALLVICSVLS